MTGNDTASAFPQRLMQTCSSSTNLLHDWSSLPASKSNFKLRCTDLSIAPSTAGMRKVYFQRSTSRHWLGI